MANKGLVTIFGGSGFLGRHLVQQLAKDGYRIRIAVRQPHLAGFLQPLGGVSQISAVYADITNEQSIKDAIHGADYVVNLVGILSPAGKQTFKTIHEQGARLIAITAREEEVKQLVHVSALGADPKSKSKYARTKAYGEDAVLNMEPNAVILRPSVVFGPEDEFYNRFASLMSIAPIVPVFAGKTKFQPVFVGDVAASIKAAIDGKAHPGTIYELGGPQIFTMKQIYQQIQDITGLNPVLLPLPLFIARIIAILTYFFPFAPITLDQIKLLKKDNVISQEAIDEKRTLTDISPLKPRAIRSIVPQYLERFETTQQAFKNAHR